MAEWASDSERAAINLSLQDKFRAPLPDTQHDFAYQFSQPPWSVAELLIPNFSGRPFSVNERWAEALPGADRMWVPSLYVGCLAFLLSIFSFRLWGSAQEKVWLTRVGLFFGVGSLGWYGLGWLFTEMTGGGEAPFGVGPQVGVIYWFLFSFMPQYSMFRYPAKLFVIASLVISLLGGLSLSKLVDEYKPTFLWAAAVLVFLLGAVVCFEPALDGVLKPYWEQVPADPLFGPFQSEDATGRFVDACFQVAIVFGIAFGTVLFFSRRRHWVGGIFAILLCGDVLFANHWMLAKTDVWMFRTTEIGPDQTEVMASGLSFPETFEKQSSPYKLGEIVTFQNRVLAPKNHLLIPARNLYSFNSIDQPDSEFRDWHLKGPFSFAVEEAEISQVFGFADNQILPVGVRTQKNGFYEFEVDIAKDGVLYIQNSFSKDWLAFHRSSDDAESRQSPVEVHSALGGLQAVRVPAGESIITFEYAPRSFYLGAWISGISWGMLVLYFGIQIVTRRKLGNGIESD